MKKQNMNDKGFSLVELIIVIAIMAILIVVLAPQYLRYVERSRNSTDMQNARTIMTALETYAADPQETDSIGPKDATITFKITSTGGSIAVANSGSATAATKALTDSGLDINKIKCSSKTVWSAYDLTATVLENGAVKWTAVSTGSDTQAFAKSMGFDAPAAPGGP